MKAIFFDLFGTLIHIGRPSGPYQQLFASVAPGQDCRHLALTRNVSFRQLAQLLGSSFPEVRLQELEAAVREEVDSTRPFPETLQVLALARSRGLAIAVSSNLAAPYGEAWRQLQGLVDYWCFSYQTGFSKPDARMFLQPAQVFRLAARDCCVVGDSRSSDGGAAATAGMRFIHLDRMGGSPGSARDLEQALDMALEM